MEDCMSDQINADECAARLTLPLRELDAESMSDAVFAINTFINHSAASNLPYQAQMLSLVRAVQRLPALEVPEPKEDEDGGHISLGDEGKKLRADMPGLGDTWGDDLMGMVVFSCPPSCPTSFIYTVLTLPVSVRSQALRFARERGRGRDVGECSSLVCSTVVSA